MTTFHADAVWPAEMHASMWMARAEARALHQEMTGKDLVITSAYRPHSVGSLHRELRAFDIRVWYFSGPAHIREFARILQYRLGPDFDVVVEGPASLNPWYQDKPPHVHVEYQPKGVHTAEVDQ